MFAYRIRDLDDTLHPLRDSYLYTFHLFIYLCLLKPSKSTWKPPTRTGPLSSSCCFTVRILSIGCDVLYPFFNIWGYFGKHRLIVHNHAAYCNNCKSKRSEVQTDRDGKLIYILKTFHFPQNSGQTQNLPLGYRLSNQGYC